MSRVLIIAMALGLSLAMPCAWAEDEILPLASVRPGMKGHGKTVFSGTRIETFPFEVVDVMRNWYPGLDIILVRCTGPMLEKARIIQGMSGSPCYIDGKVIGALAYGWNFALDALAGITPIEQMIKLARRPLEKNVSAPRAPRAPRGAGGDFGGLQPCKTPLFVSASTSAGMRYLREVFSPYNVVPIMSGGGGAFADLKAPLEPGSAIGVLLMRGDMEAYATGTVTWVKGDEVLAFGHSFFGDGEYTLPATNAWTYTVVASAQSSFKLSAIGRTVGAVVQDRQTGVFVRKGKKSRLIPYKIRIRNDNTGSVHEYNMEIADHRRWTPNMVNFALIDALSSAEPGPDSEAKEIDLVFKPRGYDEVRVRQFVASGGGFFASYGLARPLAAFLQNPFREVHVDSIRMEVRIVHEEKRGAISGVTMSRDEYFPGETVEFIVDVKRPRLSPLTFPLRIRLPKDIEPGEHPIAIRAQDEFVPWNAKAVEDVKTLLHNLRLLSTRRSDLLIAVMDAPDYRLQHKGEGMENLPVTVVTQLLPALKTGKFFAKGKLYESEPVKTGLYITGGKIVKIKIKKRAE
jgi:hypothetical protein